MKKIYGHGATLHYTETDCNSAEHKSRIATDPPFGGELGEAKSALAEQTAPPCRVNSA